MESAGLDPRQVRLRVDERLREKEFGILDRLTVRGIRERHPDLAAQRSHVGKFYFRPPGGESWCDVVLRLRSVMEMVSREHEGQRVLVVAHQVIVHCMRYLLESLEEQRCWRWTARATCPTAGSPRTSSMATRPTCGSTW
jgi:broad specificity phosphatase PhoE